jgi:hypothetical protein
MKTPVHSFVLITCVALTSVVGCGGDIESVEDSLQGDGIGEEGGEFGLATAAITASLYNRALTTADIAGMFATGPNQSITKPIMKGFLQNKVRIASADATQASNAFLAWGAASFIPDDQKRAELKAEGLNQAKVNDGLTPSEYLAYLRIAFGDGPCAGAAAGSDQCPARGIDFQMHLISLENGIFNLRTGDAQDDQYANKYTVHRESQANRQTLTHMGNILGLGGNPLKQMVIDPSNPADCADLTTMLGSATKLESFLKDKAGVIPVVARVAARQWLKVVTEVTNGVTYTYGLDPFLSGQLCSRDNIGTCYAADPAMGKRIRQLLPNIQGKTQLSCSEIATLVNVLTSMPAKEPINFAQNVAAPFDAQSPDLTVDELFDFFIALGNALTNRPDAPFADTLPLADFQLLLDSGVPNAENQFTSQVHKYFFDTYVGS